MKGFDEFLKNIDDETLNERVQSRADRYTALRTKTESDFSDASILLASFFDKERAFVIELLSDYHAWICQQLESHS